MVSVCVPDEEEEGNRWGWAEKVVKVVDVRLGREYEVRLREEAGEMRIFVGQFQLVVDSVCAGAKADEDRYVVGRQGIL